MSSRHKEERQNESKNGMPRSNLSDHDRKWSLTEFFFHADEDLAEFFRVKSHCFSRCLPVSGQHRFNNRTVHPGRVHGLTSGWTAATNLVVIPIKDLTRASSKRLSHISARMKWTMVFASKSCGNDFIGNSSAFMASKSRFL